MSLSQDQVATLFSSYVDNYSDISSLWSTASAGPGHADKAVTYSDEDYALWVYKRMLADKRLYDVWFNPADPQYNAYHSAFADLAALGRAHYANHGNQGTPFSFTWNNFRYEGGRQDFKVYLGYKHWVDFGSKEHRVIPSPKFNIDSSGNITLLNDYYWTISSPLRQQFNNIVANSYSGGLTFKSKIEAAASGLPSEVFTQLVGQGDVQKLVQSHKTKFVQKWDPTTGAAPPFGKFDANYYAKVVPKDVADSWNAGINVGGHQIEDADLTGKFADFNVFLHSHYTTTGKAQGLRGNAATPAEKLQEMETLTDAERQMYRDQVLGITPEGTIELSTPVIGEEGFVTNEPEIDTLLEKTFAETVTTADLQKQKQFNLLAQDVLKESINALKEAKRKEADISMMKKLPGYNEIMEINSTLTNSILGDSGVGGILSISGNYNKTRKQLEKSLESFTGISSNAAVYNWQKWFDDTLLKRYENLEYTPKVYTDTELKQLQQDTQKEIDIYNTEYAQYQQKLKEHQNAIASGRPSTAPTEPQEPKYLTLAKENKLNVNNQEDFKKLTEIINVKAQKDFVNSFVNKYIKPRFDQSRSMDEFISYVDVKEDEQNIFQSQSVINKLKQIADLRSKSFLDLVKQAEATKKPFDVDFYKDPLKRYIDANGQLLADKPISSKKLEQYRLQKQIIERDWQIAQKNGLSPNGQNWSVEAYIYGYENTYKNNFDEFAKLHYQVTKGVAKDASGNKLKDSDGNEFLLDPAQDILPYEELERKIKNFGKEIALRKEIYGDSSFMVFVTPEEYADAVLESVDPTKNKEEWEKLLEKLGLDYTSDLDQVKQYLIDSFRTEEAKEIRQSIKYLNEIDADINQKNLGVSYIERPEDVKDLDKQDTTKLYQVFKSAGYEGTEDDFYDNFMPDVDRSEQELVSKAMSKEGLLFETEKMEDPFSAFSKLSGFLGEDEETQFDQEEQQPKESSYFKIFGDEEEEEPFEKSKAAKSFLGEFTSMFKGFS